jgi:diamine N-acetyltransferase
MLKIRQATVADAQLIATLNIPVQQLHHEARPQSFKPPRDDAEMVAHYVDVLKNPDNRVYVGEVDGQPVGYVYAIIYNHPDNPFGYARDYIYIDQISVNPDQRGKGYGKLLTETVLDLARKEGIERVTLSMWLFNSDAQQFYQKLGFSAYVQYMAIDLEED